MKLSPTKEYVGLAIGSEQYQRVCASIAKAREQGERPHFRHLVYRERVADLLFHTTIGGAALSIFGPVFVGSAVQVFSKFRKAGRYRNLLILSPMISEQAGVINNKRYIQKILTQCLALSSGIGFAFGLWYLMNGMRGLLF